MALQTRVLEVGGEGRSLSDRPLALSKATPPQPARDGRLFCLPGLRQRIACWWPEAPLVHSRLVIPVCRGRLMTARPLVQTGRLSWATLFQTSAVRCRWVPQSTTMACTSTCSFSVGASPPN